MTNQTEIVQIPVKQLMKWDGNVRKTGADSIAELAASIRAHGMIQNLSVFPRLNKKRKSTGKFKVAAGGRRYEALLQLVEEGVFTEEYLVPSLVVDEKTALEISLAENIVREAMHPADEFMAFRAMIDGGAGIEDVAARFGVACGRLTDGSKALCAATIHPVRLCAVSKAPVEQTGPTVMS